MQDTETVFSVNGVFFQAMYHVHEPVSLPKFTVNFSIRDEFLPQIFEAMGIGPNSANQNIAYPLFRLGFTPIGTNEVKFVSAKVIDPISYTRAFANFVLLTMRATEEATMSLSE